MPDGYKAANSYLNPLVADGNADPDADGLTSLTELGLGTKPCQNDTDGDGSTDGSDNCPLVANPGQFNSDSGPRPNGTGAIGNGAGIPGDDATIPNGDAFGDVCDADVDNDSIPNASDPHPGGDITYNTDGDGDPCIPLGTDPTDHGPSWDWNCNGKLDGVEGICPLAVNPKGDDDGDGLLNTWEVCKWGTNPAVIDSDGDTRGDCVEAADVDGSGGVNFTGDVIDYAKAVLLRPVSLRQGRGLRPRRQQCHQLHGRVIQEAKFGLLPGLCK